MMARWYLQATAPNVNGCWHEMLTVDAGKQLAFLKRIFHLHEVAIRRRTSKSQSCRLSVSAFERECNAMMALAHIEEAMFAAHHPTRKDRMFPDAVMRVVDQKIREGWLGFFNMLPGMFCVG